MNENEEKNKYNCVYLNGFSPLCGVLGVYRGMLEKCYWQSKHPVAQACNH